MGLQAFLATGAAGLSQLSIKTRIETEWILVEKILLVCLSQLSIKTRIETGSEIDYKEYNPEFESAIH